MLKKRIFAKSLLSGKSSLFFLLSIKGKFVIIRAGATITIGGWFPFSVHVFGGMGVMP